MLDLASMVKLLQKLKGIKDKDGQDDGSDPLHSQLSLEEEAIWMLSASLFVYIYADWRYLSRLGRTKIPFAMLAVESDEMSLVELNQGKEHSKPLGECGKSSSEIIFLILRCLAEAGGLRRKKFDAKKTFKKAVTKVAALSAMGGLDNLKRCPKAAKFLDVASPDASIFALEELFKDAVISAPTKEESSKKHGTLGDHYGLHHIQCFFDAIENKANGQGDGVDEEEQQFFISVKDMFLGTGSDMKEWNSDIAKECCAKMAKAFSMTLHDDSQLLALTNVSQSHGSRVVWVNDLMSHVECVYLIMASKIEKRVTVVFRGTTTWADITKNTDFGVFELPNPIEEDYKGKTCYLEVNNGYSDYLFVKRMDTERSKYDEIADRVEQFGKDFGDEGYTLCVTGHSLGGALATMFGFKASTEARFTRNQTAVRVFTYGAAIPGRVSFAHAFQHQGEVVKLLHCRCVVTGDVVPLAHPQFTFDFAHTGYAVELSPSKKGTPKYHYYHDKDEWKSLMVNFSTNMFVNFPYFNPFGVGMLHSLRTYTDLIHASIAERKKMVEAGEGEEEEEEKEGGRESSKLLPLEHHYIENKIIKK